MQQIAVLRWHPLTGDRVGQRATRLDELLVEEVSKHYDH